MSLTKATYSMIDGAPVNVLDYGAVGDGVTDDTVAIQAAITSVAATGGEVYFPGSRQYLVTNKITVSSLYPISLLGEMKGQFYNPTSNAPCILVGAAMDYVIEYTAPNPLARGSSGGGLVRGLSFVDPTAVNGGSPGTRTIIAALHLKDFALSAVENCSFHWLKGSAIKADFAVMTNVKNCIIRYCGDLANPSRSVVLLSGTSVDFPVQSFILADTRIEVCYSDEYFNSAAVAYDITVRGCKFEAATTEYPNSSKKFIKMTAERFLIDGCGFNRTNAEAVETTANSRGKIIGCTFATGAAATLSLKLGSGYSVVTGNTFEDTRTAYSIEITGTAINAIVANNNFYFAGGILASGRGAKIDGNSFRNTTQTGGSNLYSIVLAADAQCANSNHFDYDGTPAVGCIQVFSGGQVFGNQFDRWSAAVCIRRENAAAQIWGNQFLTVGTAYSQSIAAGSGSEFYGDATAKLTLP